MKALGVLFAAASLFVGGAALAQARPTVSTTPSCVGVSGTPAAASAWWGRFAGGRDEMLDFAVVPVGLTVEGCFPSADACQYWLYVMKGEYSAMSTLAACSQGYGVGPTWPPGSRQ